MSALKDVGAYAGLAAFFGLAVLALLYFAQARDVRRLRENASFLVEGADGQSTAPARTPAAVAAEDPEQAAASAAASAPSDAEAFRRAELARQAAERRQRFEQRRSPPGRFGGGGRSGWLSETPSTALIAVGAVLLIAGLVFAGTRVLGGEDSSSGTQKGSKNNPCPPSQTSIAVLNGTATGGLAAQFAAPLKKQNYKTTPVTNTESPVDTSQVMFDPQTGQACAPVIAGIVGIQNVAPMTNEIRGIAGGDPVAVVLGEDQAGGGTSSTGSSGDTSTGF
jgi:LytR cell envelope-related transcriptional attenuator